MQIRTPEGTGSGFIFDEDGWVLTNAHVVGSYSEVTVIIGEKFEFTGVAVGLDEDVDLAVIKLETSEELPTLSFGDSNDVAVGDDVLAIGYPLGSILGSAATVTKGIISSKRRSGDVDHLQTDAAINPGNSGGPLVNVMGEVIGVNTSRLEEVFGIPVQGIGMAISSNSVSELLPFLKAGATVRAGPTPTSTVIPAQTPQPTATATSAASEYTSQEYWYTIEVPSGWSIDSSDSDAVAIWPPDSPSTVWVLVDEIDPQRFPTLNHLLALVKPVPAETWTDFEIITSRRIRLDSPVEAHEFLYEYVKDIEIPCPSGASGCFERRQSKRTEHWYVLGKHLVRVSAFADAGIWDTASEALETSIGLQESFEPATYGSVEYGYSLALPPGWIEVVDEQLDYVAYDPLGESVQLYVTIRPDDGYSRRVLDYGSRCTLGSFGIITRGLVYDGRTNPGYRIDYTGVSSVTDSRLRGAVLITLGGGNAIWVWVQGDEDEWTDLGPILDDIFSRVAVKP